MNYLNVLVLFGVFLGQYCECYNILAVFHLPARSHYTISSKLLNELANRGHNVTVVTPYPQKSPPKTLKEISVESLIDSMNAEKRYLFGLDKNIVFENLKFLTHMGYVLVEHALAHENIQKLLQTNEKYDVVILPHHLNEALLGIAHHFRAPLVLVDSMPQFPWGSFYLSHPAPSSYVPNLLAHFTGRMNFWQRLLNSFYDSYTLLYHQWIILPKHRELVKKYIPGQPDLYDFLNNASLLLINSHVSTYEAIPQVPNAIEVGGFFIQEPKKLPEDLQTFLDNSENGVVVFSMGSNLKSSELPPVTRDEILKAFSKLKQNVLWKWETDNMPGKPKNVKLMKWLPQSDVLAHPNVKALISHGGLLSTMESIYYGLPMIGIPIFSDQKMNMAIATSYGYAVRIHFQELNEETLSSALHQVLNDPKYRNNAKKRSSIMRDRPIKPMDNAIYWIEYVIRHQGAPHLRYPGMDLTWFQRNLLDVVAFVVVMISLSLSVIFIILKRIIKRNNSKTDARKKKN